MQIITFNDCVKTDLQLIYVFILIHDLTFLVPSQCCLAKTMNNQKGLMTISTKIVIQMNAKMGGEPWSVDIPIKVFFFCVKTIKYFNFLRT